MLCISGARTGSMDRIEILDVIKGEEGMNCQILGLNKSYGSKQALIDFSCTLEPGIYGLLGPNGAGKSTLLNIISRNLRPDTGTVLLGNSEQYLDKLGYMPQQQTLYEDFSARTFLYYMAGLKKVKSPKAEIEHLLEVVNLKEVAHKRMGAFSGGMKQRILLSQALLGNPRLLLLDEPTAGLDPVERIRIRNFISEFSKDRIVLLATHVVSDIEYIARQVIMLKDGCGIGVKSTGEWLETVSGKVGDILVAEDEIEDYQKFCLISNLFREKDGIRLRVICEDLPKGAEPVKPTLEDVYLYYNGAGEAEDEI